jgi:hypothetical protein
MLSSRLNLRRLCPEQSQKAVKASEYILLPQDICPELKIAGASADKTFATPDEALNSYATDLENATQQLKEFKDSGKPLDAISFVFSELYSPFIGGKLQIVDVNCKDELGNNIAIEMQSAPMTGDRLDNNFLNQTCRSVRCVSRLCASSPAALQGKPYKAVPKACLVNFRGFTVFQRDETKSQDPENLCGRLSPAGAARHRLSEDHNILAPKA